MAGDESGLDNSPMWDGVKFNKQSHTMEQDDVGLSSLWALDAWALAEIAHVLGLSQQEKSMRQDFLDMSSRVNKLMWSERMACIEDVPGLLFPHYWKNGARHIQQAKEICLEQMPNLGIRRILKNCGQSVAGVVHEDVDAAELFFAGSNGRLDAFRVGDIELSDEHLSRVRCLQVFQLCHVACGGDQSISLVEDRFG